MVEMKNFKILVTPTSFGKNDPRLKAELEERVGEVIYNPTGKPLSSAEVARLLPGMDGYIAGLDVIDRKALASADCLKIIARYGVGVDNVDLSAAREKGIMVTNTPGANSVSVAELTVGLILALARQIPQGVSATRLGLFPRLNGLSITGKTVGIVGLGSIGKQVARRLSGFDCQILAYDAYPDSNFANQNNVRYTSLDELLSASDYVSLHLPLLPETRGMVNRQFLTKIKQGAYIVNTARGELIDEAALLDALKSGHIRGAALDVFTQEPPPPDHPLLALPQVIATPHLGAQTDGAVNAMGWMSFHECMAVLSGEAVKYRIV
jgi:D-3-phosphoglycerate dehydrogenase